MQAVVSVAAIASIMKGDGMAVWNSTITFILYNKTEGFRQGVHIFGHRPSVYHHELADTYCVGGPVCCIF